VEACACDAFDVACCAGDFYACGDGGGGIDIACFD
jgi:hypothetical protein